MSVHILYRMFDDQGRLLYVGMTANPPQRFKHHKFTRAWWEQVCYIRLQHCSSRRALQTAEREAIQCEMPMYNVHNNAESKNRGAVEVDARELCECDFCDSAAECAACDACSGRLAGEGEYQLVPYAEVLA